MGNEVVGIDIVARLDGFRSELAKIPDIGGKEAKALVGQLARQIKSAEQASRGAASAARAHKVEVQGLSAAILKANFGMEAFKKVVDISTRAIGALVERAAEIDGEAKAAVEGLRASTQGLTDSLAIALVPAITTVTHGLADLADGAKLAVDWLTGMDDVQRRSIAGQEAASKAIERQASKVEELRAEIKALSGLSLSSDGSGPALEGLQAQLSAEIGVLRRLRGELGQAGTARPAVAVAAGETASVSGAAQPAAQAVVEPAVVEPAVVDLGIDTAVVEEGIAATRGLEAALRGVEVAALDGAEAVRAAAEEEVAVLTAQLDAVVSAETVAADAKIALIQRTADAQAAIRAAADADILAMAAEQDAALAEIETAATQRRVQLARQEGAARIEEMDGWLGASAVTFAAVSDIAMAAADIGAAAAKDEAKERKKQAKALWAVQSAMAIAQAGVNVPLAISNAISNAPNPIVGAVMGIAAGIASGAALAATIAKAAAGPKFHGGGIVGDERPATLLTGEAVLNRDATRRLGEDGVRRANAGVAMGQEIRVQQVFRHRVLDEVVLDSMRRGGGPLYDAIAATRPRSGSHAPSRA